MLLMGTHTHAHTNKKVISTRMVDRLYFSRTETQKPFLGPHIVHWIPDLVRVCVCVCVCRDQTE